MEFMPIHEVGTGGLHGFEALARGPQGEHSAELYAVARRTGALADLDRQCLRTALRAANALDSDYRLFVNVSPSSIAGGRLLSELGDISSRPERIVLQIVPFEAIHDHPRFLAALTPALELGCRVALGGVGTGYSSLALLTHAPVHYLKADASYLQPHNPVDDLPLRAMGGLAQSLSLRFVVPGCDSERHLSTALACGADLVQGTYVGNPSQTPQNAPSSSPVLKRMTG